MLPLLTTVCHTMSGMHIAYSGPHFSSILLAMSMGLPVHYYPASSMMPMSSRFYSSHHSNMKPMKLDLSPFYGEDPNGWLAMAEHFLEYREVEEPRKVMVVAMHLGGDASLWMKWYEARYSRESWTIFSKMFLQ